MPNKRLGWRAQGRQATAEHDRPTYIKLPLENTQATWVPLSHGTITRSSLVSQNFHAGCLPFGIGYTEQVWKRDATQRLTTGHNREQHTQTEGRNTNSDYKYRGMGTEKSKNTDIRGLASGTIHPAINPKISASGLRKRHHWSCLQYAQQNTASLLVLHFKP